MLPLLTSTSSSAESGSSGGSLESLKKVFTNPVLYIVIGALVLLIIVIYLIRRFIKARPNATTIVVRRGKIYKVLDKDNPKCFLVPFMDSIGAIITDSEKEFSSDKLFINNGPDSLYKVNYTLQYKVTDVKEFYPYVNKIQEIMVLKINDGLREYADKGHAFVIVKDYREKEQEID